ncbi:MAG: preprotein translocase subunit SecY [Bacillati bacterium ANGP1]|uniref:Protein translocase subunit SecY n=1 Tax=Candidatus Segetimicrobium genomatis TaxID=2569760 RepID=A0A537JW58_9BACT|nr:MAG: preprotein translocase subunit SecY [Terrabacteria group bacterium ANGP1]
MIPGLTNIIRIPDLRRKFLFTIGMLAIFRLGSHIPVPGVDVARLQSIFSQQGNVFGFIDLFVGGALSRFALFALGVFPYITASIIFSLLEVVFPRLKEIHREEGEAGRRRIGQYTLYLSVFLAVIQAIGQTILIRNLGALPDARPLVFGEVVTTLVAGTMVLTWMGSIMTEYGIGNGVSLLIFGGIVARLPNQLKQTVALARVGESSVLFALFDIAMILASIVLVIFVTQAVRKVPIQYAKRIVGRRMVGGQTTHLPIRIASAGVIPIIFAISVLQFPQTVAQFSAWPWLQRIGNALSINNALGAALYFILIIVFTYFYTAVSFDPDDVSDNIKKYGGFVPGIRPGRPTTEFLTRILERLTLVGAIFLGLIAVGPIALGRFTGQLTLYLAGTSLLIVVGVALETMKQIEAYVLMRHYEGFMK